MEKCDFQPQKGSRVRTWPEVLDFMPASASVRMCSQQKDVSSKRTFRVDVKEHDSLRLCGIVASQAPRVVLLRRRGVLEARALRRRANEICVSGVVVVSCVLLGMRAQACARVSFSLVLCKNRRVLRSLKLIKMSQNHDVPTVPRSFSTCTLVDVLASNRRAVGFCRRNVTFGRVECVRAVATCRRSVSSARVNVFVPLGVVVETPLECVRAVGFCCRNFFLDVSNASAPLRFVAETCLLDVLNVSAPLRFVAETWVRVESVRVVAFCRRNVTSGRVECVRAVGFCR